MRVHRREPRGRTGQNQELSVKDAVFVEFGDGSEQLVLLAANQSNLCDVLTAKTPPQVHFVGLMIALEDVGASGPQPVVPGPYLQTFQPEPVGLFSFSTFYWMEGCGLIGLLVPSHGTVTVDSFGGRQDGSHLVVSLDLSFGSEHLGGKVDATYCPGPRTFGTVCPRSPAPFFPRPDAGQ